MIQEVKTRAARPLLSVNPNAMHLFEKDLYMVLETLLQNLDTYLLTDPPKD